MKALQTLSALARAATGDHGTDLMEADRRALATDPALQAAHEARSAGREKIVQGRSRFKPQLPLSAGLAQVDDHGGSSLPQPQSAYGAPHSEGRVHQAALQLLQPLVNAKSRAERSRPELQWDEQRPSLRQRVGEAAAVAPQRERVQARFEVGRGQATEVQEARARQDGVKRREVSAQNTLALRQAQYRELTGLPPQDLAGPAPGFAPRRCPSSWPHGPARAPNRASCRRWRTPLD